MAAITKTRAKIAPQAAESPLRVSCALRSRAVRDELAGMVKAGNWTHLSELNASADKVAEFLAGAPDEVADAEFFDSRRFSEAIVLEKARPVLLVKNGRVEEARLKELEQLLKKHRSALVKPVNSVGRIELMDHDSMDWCGTGWRIDDDIIVTNRHVAALFAQRQGSQFRFRVNQAGKTVRPRVDFREEYRQPQSSEYAIVDVLWLAQDVAEAPDMAILRVLRDPGLPEPLVLAKKDAAPRLQVAVVGYPARDSRNDAGVMQSIFGDIYDVKRFAPGEVVGVPKDQWYLTHDCSTLGGNSGSAVLSIETREVVGLHFGGQFRKTNFAVKASMIRTVLKRRAWVPVTATELKIRPEAFSEKKRTVASLAGRKGFDVAFLGRKLPMPRPAKGHEVLHVGTGTRLDYMHFSVVMSATRRLPIVTAVNIDGEKKKSLKRKDAWGFDPRIPNAAQVGHKAFYGPAAFDKGHMVRREDPGWGDTIEEARQGEEDSFVYTNAVPQMPQLNQKVWLSLEDYVLQSARTHGFRVSVFTGPVLRDGDPTFEDIAVPVDFWKVIAMIDSDDQGLVVSAYMLSQEGMMPTEGFRYGPFRTYQVPLSKVAEQARLGFSKAMHKADVFEGTGLEESFRFGRFREITGPGDLVLARPKR